jgi:hypothetical protein
MRLLVATALALLTSLSGAAYATDAEDALEGPTLDLTGTMSVTASEWTVRGGPGFRATAWPMRLMGGEFSVQVQPDAGSREFTPLVQRLAFREEVVPEISRELLSVQGAFVIAPLLGKFRGPGGEVFDLRWLFNIGGGMVMTQDDTELVEETSPCHGNSVAQNSAIAECAYIQEVHPIFTVGTGVRASFGGFLLGFDLRFDAHEESFYRGFGGPTEVGVNEIKRFLFTVTVGGAIPLSK